MYHDDLKLVLTSWVSQGGNVAFQGEGSAGEIFKDWFNLSWSHTGYHRSENVRSKKQSLRAVQSTVLSRLPAKYSAKVCWLSGVDRNDRVYVDKQSPELCGVACTSYQLGKITFVGDVNAEDSTVTTLVELGKMK